jgi:glycosyltransferase involved in cell wall biosynthesis
MSKQPPNGVATPVVDSADAECVPEVSVVITTRDRAGLLEPTLASLAAQATGDTSWELILIDNGSTDTTPAVIAAASAQLPIRSYRFEPAGKCRAQNFALEQVRGELVVFSDDDVSCEPGWLNALWRAAVCWPDADLFGGAIRVRLIDGVPDWLDNEAGRAIIERHCAHYHPRDDEGFSDVPPIGPNMAVRKRTLVDIRFDENVGPDGTQDYIKGGDTDLNQTLMARGHRCVFVPGAVVHHHAYARQLRLEELVRGAYRRGRKNAYLYPKSGGLQVAGAPAKLWLQLAKQWLRFRLASRSNAQRRYQLGTKYFYRLGYLRQVRHSAESVQSHRT